MLTEVPVNRYKLNIKLQLNFGFCTYCIYKLVQYVLFYLYQIFERKLNIGRHERDMEPLSWQGLARIRCVLHQTQYFIGSAQRFWRI